MNDHLIFLRSIIVNIPTKKINIVKKKKTIIYLFISVKKYSIITNFNIMKDYYN